jgi:lipopolysaccharide/colanic/teichoic acid biosynthesis glycosyltransferase
MRVVRSIDRGSKLRPRRKYLRLYPIAKRLTDLAAVLIAAPPALVVGAVCAALIKLESPDGPVLFRQRRVGRGGVPFMMLKFRTMVPEAERIKRELMYLNQLQGPDFKIENDPRITRVGRILRKTSLDEIPQLLNVLRGEMSLVGPRPTSFHASTYELWQTERLDVPAGLTGLWQVVARGSSEFDERCRLDIEYIRNRSWWLDAKILILTVAAVMARRGAY